jgi:hypothetical protein
MDWNLRHTNVFVNDTGNTIKCNCQIDFKTDTVQITIANTKQVVDYRLGSKKILMDTAYRFEEMAREMKKKAEQIT